VSSSSKSSDVIQAFSAGFVEGYLTAPLVEPYIRNVFSHRFHDPIQADPNVTQARTCRNAVVVVSTVEGTVCNARSQFITDNLRWTMQQVQQLSAADAYWAQVGLNLAILRGITAGVNEVYNIPFISFYIRHCSSSHTAL
jgi:hypothetical protein